MLNRKKTPFFCMLEHSPFNLRFPLSFMVYNKTIIIAIAMICYTILQINLNVWFITISVVS